jgi:hypothetical protein
VYGAQLVLRGQFLRMPESTSAAFFEQLKAAMSTFPVPAWHNTAVRVTPPVRLPEELPEDLMQIKKVLVCVDGHKPLLAPLTWAKLD